MLDLRSERGHFFEQFITVQPHERIIFKFGPGIQEIWTPNIHQVPTTNSLWLADALPAITTELYLSYSAAQLITFANGRPQLLSQFADHNAFAAMGHLPSISQVRFLKLKYPHARWHLLFGNDLLGRIAEASIAAWFKGHDPKFTFENEQLLVRYRNKVYRFNAITFSMSRFEKATGLRSGMRTHKIHL